MNFEMVKSCNEANQDLCEQGVLLTPESIVDELIPIDMSKPYSLCGGIAIANYIDSDGKRKIISAPPGHTLLVGSTGSGKTEAFYLPQIEIIGRSSDMVSFVVMDMKGNMYRQKAQMLKENGFEVIVLNGKNPFASSKFNPLTTIFRAYRRAKDAEKALMKANPKKLEFLGKKYDDYLDYKFDVELYINTNMAYSHQMIDKMCEIIVPIEGSRDPSWDYGAREIVKSLLYLMLDDSDNEKNPMTEEKFTIYNMAKLLECRSDDCDELITYVRRHKSTSLGYKLLSYIESRAKQTRDSFLMTAADKVNRIVNIPMNAMSMFSDIDTDELARTLGSKRTAIFLIADSANKSIYALCNMFLIQLIVALQKYGDENPKGDFHIFADEFCNMVPMPDIIDWITTMRSRRTWFHLGIQSYSQLEHHYDPETRATIEGNSKTIFMGSNDFMTLDAFSKAAGLTMKISKAYNVDNGGNLSLSMTPTNAPLVRVSDLANMKLGEAYVKMFGATGNKMIKTVLEPDFKSNDFAHGNTEPEVVKRHIVTPEENLYNYKAPVQRNAPTKRNWDDFFNFDTRPSDKDFNFQESPIFTATENQTQTKMKGIIAKLSENEKKFLIDAFKDKSYEDANKYLSECKDVVQYLFRLRSIGLIAYAVTNRLAISKREYEIFMNYLKADVESSDKKESMLPGTKGFAEKSRSEISDYLKFSVFESNFKSQWKMAVNSDGDYDIELPNGDKVIKLTMLKSKMKLTDNGETFKYLNNYHKDNAKRNTAAIDCIINSFGVTKRTQANETYLEKAYVDEKKVMQDALALYTVIKTVGQIGMLGAAFPNGQ